MEAHVMSNAPPSVAASTVTSRAVPMTEVLLRNNSASAPEAKEKCKNASNRRIGSAPARLKICFFIREMISEKRRQLKPGKTPDAASRKKRRGGPSGPPSTWGGGGGGRL